ncbi:MAG: N-acetylmuramoyl-L-alanine amidase, partial [Actinobacteria bacterium]|nr:N-acetylmuramoyl-L-alanine amidase [Actinomycetota bacterium]
TPQVASVKVVQSSPQKKVLSIRGSFPQPIIKEFGGGSHLAVYLGGVEANPAFLQLNSKELGTVSVRDTGVLVSFNEKPRYTVVKNAPGEVQIQFEASLDGATLGQSGDRQVLTFQTSGFADPDAYFDGATGLVNLALPNTALKGEIRGLSNSTVRSVSARQDGNQVRVTVDSAVKGRFLMRRGPNKVALEFLPAGVKGKTIVLDAGHGGRDPGAGGPAGLKEKDVNLSIALKLKPLLEKAGAKVVMTRTGDTEGAPASELDKLTAGERIVEDLHSRAELANRSGADLFLSIHNNSDPSGGQSGTTTYWTDVNFNADRSRALALSLQGEMVKALGRKDNGIKSNDFYVIRNSLAPAALAEVLFVSDPAEEGLLKQGATQDKIAQALYQGLVKFYQ